MPAGPAFAELINVVAMLDTNIENQPNNRANQKNLR
jgi:hypothetical protein